MRSQATAMRPKAKAGRRETRRARTRCSRLWAASLCFATTPSSSGKKGLGKSKATQPREHSIRSQASSAWRATEQAASPRIDAIPFESEHKFMATLHKSAAGKETLLVKGAPEVILENCDRQQTASGQATSLDPAHFMQASDRLAAQGERVLALAWLESPTVKAGSLGPADLPKTLVLLGLIGLLDPPRKEAIEAVKECHGGGIRVTMITGDHKITAAAIAKMLGIGDGNTAITGGEIEDMDTATLQERVRDVDVFARASPEHKLRLVKAIQANKQIVAMTGDGVNDAPSLKKADIGVAMGIKGTEVTKEAAGMILADDNFASITAAVK